MKLIKIIRLEESRSRPGTQEEQIAAVYNNWTKISRIDNPSEAVQLTAVQQSLRAIQYIKNPTENVQLFVVKYIPVYVTMIEHPTHNVVRIALKDTQFIKHEPEAYFRFVRRHFADNALLMKKWLRYGETIREQ
ncbi:hypothetical protein M0R04_07665 [Candidatus Dojkabacteria bacterium]|jgi:hypothetical protein|nr:hypothetical protein [Candidatus Dojkabacteria bacterium]